MTRRSFSYFLFFVVLSIQNFVPLLALSLTCGPHDPDKLRADEFWTSGYQENGVNKWEATGKNMGSSGDLKGMCLVLQGDFVGQRWSSTNRGKLMMYMEHGLRLMPADRSMKLNALCEIVPDIRPPHCPTKFLLKGQMCYHLSKCAMTYADATKYCAVTRGWNVGRLLSDMDLIVTNRGDCCYGESLRTVFDAATGTYLIKPHRCKACGCTRCKRTLTPLQCPDTNKEYTMQVQIDQFWTSAYQDADGVNKWEITGNNMTANDISCLTLDGDFKRDSWTAVNRGKLSNQVEIKDHKMSIRLQEENSNTELNAICEIESKETQPHCPTNFSLYDQVCYHASACTMTYADAANYCGVIYGGKTGRLLSDMDCNETGDIKALLNRLKQPANHIDACGCHNPCKNNATCVNSETAIGEKSCICSDGWIGPNCTEDFDECSSNPCQHNGTCQATKPIPIDQYKCTCFPGFTGKTCDDINECKSNPCVNNGTCSDLPNKFTCTCPPRYTGVQCEDYDYCYGVSCNNGNCRNGPSYYNCTCFPGYTGRHCEIDINECTHDSNNVPLIHPINCHNGICHNRIAKYECVCTPGYSWKHCEHGIDECESDPCQNNATCHNLINMYSCQCVPGYIGTNCETDINECASNPCQHSATCDDNINHFQCNCVNGFNGTFCEWDIEECASNPCQNNGTCKEPALGMFTCDCHEGTSGDRCENNFDECHSNPCVGPNSTCENHFGRYICVCIPEYTDVNCQLHIDQCASNPCQNNATCVDNINHFQCSCLNGYIGTFCEHEMTECESDPCQNGATCFDLVNRWECRCMPGFFGRFCEQDIIDECQSNPCQNGALCLNWIDYFKCHCLPGYSGTFCEIPIANGCQNNLCQNNATCHDYAGSYMCECHIGTLGYHCEITAATQLQRTDQCWSNPCYGNATCENHFDRYLCKCPPKYSGDHCDRCIDECQSNPCQNGAVCEDKYSFYRCHCQLGYAGINCEIGTSTLTPNDPSFGNRQKTASVPNSARRSKVNRIQIFSTINVLCVSVLAFLLTSYSL